MSDAGPPSFELMVETVGCVHYIYVHRFNMVDHELHCLEGAIEDFPRDLEFLQVSVHRSLETPQAWPNSERFG